MLTNKQIDNRTKKLETLEREIAELEAKADAVKTELKAELEERDLEELTTESGKIIRWQLITSKRFDSKAFKNAHPAMYAAFINVTSSHRFTIA